MSNCLISIGCDEYGSLDNLSGAENDAESIFHCLTSGSSSIYSKSTSVFLKSPTTLDLKSAILEYVYKDHKPEIVTFYFAGHGILYKGTYYLCLNDSEIEKIGLTASALSDVIRSISSSGISTINVVVDACNSAGLVNDITSILKPEIMGESGSCSISILVAAASNEYAYEESGHGIFTQQLLNILNGEEYLSDSAEYFDLISIGQKLSESFGGGELHQTPSSWAFNLYGPSVFAKNPLFSADENSNYRNVSYIPPDSKLGVLVGSANDDLMAVVSSLDLADSPVKLLHILQSISSQTDSLEHIPGLVNGIGIRIVELIDAADVFSRLEFTNVLLSFLIRYWNDAECNKVIKRLMQKYNEQGSKYLEGLEIGLENEKYYLFPGGEAKENTPANYFYLPLRISKILGYLAQVLFANPKTLPLVNRISNMILEQYSAQFKCVNEKQAAELYVFFHVFAQYEELRSFCIGALCCYSDNFLQNGGLVTKYGIGADQALEFTMQRHAQKGIDYTIVANPASLGAVIIYAHHVFGLNNQLDKLIHNLDRRNIHIFVPENVEDFSDEMIEDGNNIVLKCGFDFWTTDEFVAEMQLRISECKTNILTEYPNDLVMCILSSAMIQPDRLPIMGLKNILTN